MTQIITQQLVEVLAQVKQPDYSYSRHTLLNDCFTPPAPGVEPYALPDNPRMLKPHPLLRTLPLNEIYAVAFVPSLSRVAVLNQAALTTLSHLPLGAEHTDITTLETIEQLWNAGLLCMPHTPPVALPETETLTAWLHVTNSCNLRCTYCYIAKSQEQMSPAIARGAIDAIIRTARLHAYPEIFLKYAGGEASLALDTITAMHQYAQQQATLYGLRLSAALLSNGVALTPARLNRIRELGLRLMISLDGMAATNDAQRPTLAGKGSTHAVLGGIERSLAVGITPEIAITVTGQSVAGLPDLVGWLSARDLPFSMSFYRDHGCGRDGAQLRFEEQQLITGMRAAYAQIAQHPPRWSILSALLDRTDAAASHHRGCAAGHSYLVIDHHGQITKCQTQLDTPVTTIDATDPLAVIRSDARGMLSIPVEQKQGCRSCEWQSWCAGGCAVATYRATGRYDVQSPNCTIYKALYPDLIRLEGQRMLHWYRELAEAE